MAEYIERESFKQKYLCCGYLPEMSEKEFDEFPTADVAPVVHGKWIEDHDYLKCPECGVMVKWDFTFFDIGNWNYCPNCGAKMNGGNDDGLFESAC